MHELYELDLIGRQYPQDSFMTKVTATFLLSLGLHFQGLSQMPYKYVPPPDLGDGWETASLIDLGFPTDGIQQMCHWLKNEQHDIHSMLIIHKNKLVLEEYFNGYSTLQPHDLRSVTKSLRSILLGIAIDQGVISSINDPIFTYLKSHKPRKNISDLKYHITIENLLTMSSGLDCNDWDKKSKGQEDKVHKKKDWIQYTLDLPMIHEPGEVASYCSMGTILLAEIIDQASGMPIQAFAQQYLFEPLGVVDFSWGHTSEKDVIDAGKRLYMSPRDMAKIGQLILNEGKWQGKQVVSAKWIQEATASKTEITGIDYGYLWWNLPFPYQGKSYVAKAATGNGGQYILVFPELELTMTFTGGAYNSEKDKIPFAIVRDVLLPTFAH